jgi:hypothetical protein
VCVVGINRPAELNPTANRRPVDTVGGWLQGDIPAVIRPARSRYAIPVNFRRQAKPVTANSIPTFQKGRVVLNQQLQIYGND